MKLLPADMFARHKPATNEPRAITINKGHVHLNYKGNYTSTTKYNVVTYLPKALFEQFRRVANTYFALVAGLSCLSISPVAPATTFAPLIFVLGVSMMKELAEDIKRYRADREINARLVLVFNTDTKAFEDRPWRAVKVGDILQVQKDTFFPADLLLLSVPESADGLAYVETINLDGESNLKIKKALDQTQQIRLDTLSDFTGEVQCEQPNASLYTFTGNLMLAPPVAPDQRTIPLSQASLLLRGSSLRNTKYVYGAVIFAGHESKVMMNATLPPSKRSRVEREMDWLILFMFALLLAMCIIGAVAFSIWTHHLSPDQWYLAPDRAEGDTNPKRPGVVGIDSFISSFILYGYLIPISLYVSLEMVKVFQSGVFIGKDRAMYHAQTDTPAQARTSNLNEELGMVDTILSDKTGTLTCNMMEFFKASIAGVSYGQGVTEIEKANARRNGSAMEAVEDPAAVPWKQASFNFYDKRILGGAWEQEARPAVLKEFFRVLAVCHTVIPDGPADPAKIKYEAESPDEAALVAAGKVFGFFFYKRTNTTVFVRESEGGLVQEREYEILNILEFDSTRKRMSVICRTPEGKLKLYCKGADTVIYERLASNNPVNNSMKGVTREHMEQYGAAGLRTLCLAYCELDKADYDAWQQKYFEAKTALEGREEKLAAVGDLIERELLLLGCTAIEDKLQAGVPEAIERLANAGIKIWVLTGDKQETAINIGFACSLLRNDMTQYIISANLPEVLALEEAGKMDDAYALAHSKIGEQLQDAMQCMAESKAADGGDNALIIDGKALLHALATDLKGQLLQVGQQCAAVICCRVSPKQKALVTALVKTTGDTTLGIGDGANDVGMIQEAHIGVGISGQEGMQAVMSSDFSIAQFRFLETLLLVHGRWSYARITRMVLFFFYKNLLFGLTIFYFNCLCFFSGQTLYNDFYMSLYNVVFTALTPLIVGTMDSDVNREMSRKYPGLYQAGPRNRYFDLKAVTGWLLNSFFQSLVVFVMVMGTLTPLYADRHSGRTAGQWQTGATLFTAVIITVHVEISSVIDHWTWVHAFSVTFSVFIWFVYMLIYGVLPQNLSQGVFHLFEEVMAGSPTFWLLIIMAPLACVLPGYLWRQIRSHFWPDDKRIVQEIMVRVQRGELARMKSLHANAGPLSDKLTRPSHQLERPSFINSGYVPQDKPGASGYFTPRSSALYANDCFDHADCTSRNPVTSQLNGELHRNPFRHRTARKLHTHLRGAEGGDGIGKGGVGLHSKLRPASGSQVLNHEPQSGVVLFPKGYSNEVSLTADAKINDQRSAAEADTASDTVKAFSPSAQSAVLPQGPGADSRQPQPLRPVRTLMPASAGSGPLPTPHAVPNQSPPAHTGIAAADLTASGRASSSSSSSSAAGSGSADGSFGSVSEVSYSHVTPYVESTGNDDAGLGIASSPLIGGGRGAGLPQTGRPRQPRPVQRRGLDQV